MYESFSLIHTSFDFLRTMWVTQSFYPLAPASKYNTAILTATPFST